MTTDEAIDTVLGKWIADNIRSTQGEHWALIAAMTGCMTSHGPNVKHAIDAGLDELKNASAPAAPN